MDGILNEKEQLKVYEVLLELHIKAVEMLEAQERTESNIKLMKLRQKAIENYLDVIRQKKELLANQG